MKTKPDEVAARAGGLGEVGAFWSMKKEDAHLDLNVYGEIGGAWWDEDGTNAKQFVEALQEHKEIDTITVHINSVGGSAFDGIAMRNALKQHPAKVTNVVEGLAASAASILLTQGTTHIMTGGMVMIHEPWTYAIGNAGELEDIAKTLRKIVDAVVPLYGEKVDLEEDEIRKLLEKETYLTAEEALKIGLADSIDTTPVKVSAEADGVYFGGVSFAVEKMPAVILNMARPQAKEPGKKKEIKKMTLKELREQYAELAAQLVAEGVELERKRIKEIENIAPAVGFVEMVTRAKYDNPVTAESLAVQILAAQKKRAVEMLSQRQKDVEVLEQVAANADITEDKEAQRIQAKKAFKAGLRE